MGVGCERERSGESVRDYELREKGSKQTRCAPTCLGGDWGGGEGGGLRRRICMSEQFQEMEAIILLKIPSSFFCY